MKLKVSTIYFSLGAINGGWSAYSQWGVCSEVKYCLQGIKKRTRSCNNPIPANGGDECTGTKEEEKICPTLEDGCTSELIYSFLSWTYVIDSVYLAGEYCLFVIFYFWLGAGCTISNVVAGGAIANLMAFNFISCQTKFNSREEHEDIIFWILNMLLCCSHLPFLVFPGVLRRTQKKQYITCVTSASFFVLLNLVPYERNLCFHKESWLAQINFKIQRTFVHSNVSLRHLSGLLPSPSPSNVNLIKTMWFKFSFPAKQTRQGTSRPKILDCSGMRGSWEVLSFRIV